MRGSRKKGGKDGRTEIRNYTYIILQVFEIPESLARQWKRKS
jgi:hypothetical protein